MKRIFFILLLILLTRSVVFAQQATFSVQKTFSVSIQPTVIISNFIKITGKHELIITKIIPPNFKVTVNPTLYLQKLPTLSPFQFISPYSMTPLPAKTAPISQNPLLRKSKDELIQMAKNHLLEKLKIKIEEITIKSVEEKQWSDASLGCPEGRKAYAQVITPGYLITLEVKEKTYEYHSSLAWITLCSGSEPTIIPISSRPNFTIGAMTQTASQIRRFFSSFLSIFRR